MRKNLYEILDSITQIQEKDVNNLSAVVQRLLELEGWKISVDQQLKDLQNHIHPHDYPYQKPLSEIIMK